ncbi:uncharacterized protein LOC136742246 [Amia ocellicauda]|uniref:uncharacterized protein LOC136742246 n=1 Tax=Amia ocellicauda TaxID=2972642 RepID=UPI0034648793
MAICLLLSLCCALTVEASSPHVVVQREAVVYRGQTVILNCTLLNMELPSQIVQVSWDQGGKPVAVYNPNYGISYPSGDWGGRLSLTNGSTLLSSLSITGCRNRDNGNYSCIFTIFPSGSHYGQVTLTVEELVEIPVTQPISADCVDHGLNSNIADLFDWPSLNVSSPTDVKWYRLGQGGPHMDPVLKIWFEGSWSQCSGELLDEVSGCHTEPGPNETQGSGRYQQPLWTPSPSQAGRYRCEWTNGLDHFQRVFHLQVKDLTHTAQQDHTITALVVTGVSIFALLVLVALVIHRRTGSKPMNYRIDHTQTAEIIYSSVWTSSPASSAGTEADNQEGPVYINVLWAQRKHESVYSEVRLRMEGNTN